ncbi:MAG: NAD(P)/FAD-dependent oxidoreductase [Candidatus Eremiobacteraeota bacterium]|nr:NAD(P)/FAD-dependent oxidoreductase [Candidatus Eremiobacteraeota bacterium]
MDADIVIIGAGVVGLAVAAHLAGTERVLYVLERNEKFGQETSSRNSEVIHGGLYYRPESLKARLCLEGNRMLYEFCEKHGIPSRRIGKLIVANSDEEREALENVRKNAVASGVKGIRWLTRQEIISMEPAIAAEEALFSESTGIIDSHRLMRHFLVKAEEQGGQVVYRSFVSEVEKLDDGYSVKVAHSCRNCFDFTTRLLINCAGLDAHNIAAALGHRHRIHFCKGSYFSVGNGKERHISHLVYPPPEMAGLGIHATLDLGGRMRLGPDTEYVQDPGDYHVDETRSDAFFERTRPFLPFLEARDLAPDIAGMRPKLQGPGEGFHDFLIFFDPPGALHLLGIESPGLTSSPAIARLVEAMLKEQDLL